jgi:hypothetical protein
MAYNGLLCSNFHDKKILDDPTIDRYYKLKKTDITAKKIHSQTISRSRSWNSRYIRSHWNSYIPFYVQLVAKSSYKLYDAINNCRSAGVIPYTIHHGTLYFLFQHIRMPIKKKDTGWNDFGGKRISTNESTAETAAREFSEETSCLFYLKEMNNDTSKNQYELLKDREDLFYDNNVVETLKMLIPLSQKFFFDRITEFALPLYISSKETYISYFVRVEYIPEKDIPRAEDIHISYDVRYIRDCKWFSIYELMDMDEKSFHKRLQITRIKQRIYNYYSKDLFI